jgi:hypothetical protein
MKGIVLSELLNQSKQKDAPKKLKPIELVRIPNLNGGAGHIAESRPAAWKHVMLLAEDFLEGLDLIWATDSGENGVLYLGHWNDGVTE